MTSDRRLSVSAPARRDVRDILQFTLVTWGEEKSDEYSRKLTSAIQHLVEHPEMGTARPDLFKGARILVVEHHVVFYRVEPDRVRIVRVLHEKSDASRVFKRSEP